MQIFIKNLNGTQLMKVEKTDTIESIMSQIEKNHGFAIQDQLLISSGKILNKKNSFKNITEGSIIDFSIKLNGGGRNRMEFDFRSFVEKKIYSKKICRKCYANNTINAKVCRKRKCGNCPDLRQRSTWRYYRKKKKNF